MEFEFKKSQGQADKAIIESKKARIAYRKERGLLLPRDLFSDFVIACINVHNSRTLTLPEKIVDLIISIVRSNTNDIDARTKLQVKLKDEISNILEGENEELKSYIKKKKAN